MKAPRPAQVRQSLVLGLIALLLAAACGPMVDRLIERQQLEFEQGWKNVIAAGPDLDRQGRLDVMVATFAVQRGIDRLEFRSEEEIDDQLVVMEIRSDRSRPEHDTSDITVFDAERRILRKESHSREDVEGANGAMYGVAPKSPRGVKTVDDWSRYWKKADTRRVRVSRPFPLFREEDDPPADALIPADFLPQGA